jgi:hypothetical protein
MTVIMDQRGEHHDAGNLSRPFRHHATELVTELCRKQGISAEYL